MTKDGRRFLVGSVFVGLGINIGFWLIQSCDAPLWLKLIEAGGGSCAEFWLNRYQTLIGGGAALAGAWITIRAMYRQSETLRSDEADRRLSRYAAALLSVMEKHENAKPIPDGEPTAEGEAYLRDLNATTDGDARQAMTDGIMGPDKSMVALFINSCRFSAIAKVFGRPDNRHTNMTWPLYMALTNGITVRQAMLLKGAKISDLYDLSTIDHKEVQRAFVANEMPEIF
jgi:hypothetical protein